MLSAPAFPFPLFYYYFPSSKFYICLFPSFLPLFAYKFVFFLSFGLLVCRSVVLSSLTYLVLFGVFSIFFKNFRSQSVFFNKPKLFPYPQTLCNTWRNIGNQAFLVRSVICHCVTYKWYAWIEEVKTTVSLSNRKSRSMVIFLRWNKLSCTLEKDSRYGVFETAKNSADVCTRATQVSFR